MESLNFTALFSLLDKEKQQMLLTQLNLISAKEKEESMSCSVRASPAAGAGQQSKDKGQPATSLNNSFTAEELLAPGNTAAQKYVKFMLKEASRRAGIWEKALLFKKITPEKWNVFNQLVVEFCPQLKDQLHRVITALSVSLVNRRNYLRRSGKMQKKQSKHSTKDKELSTQNNVPAATVSKIGTTVSIYYKGTVISRGVLLKEEDVLLKTKFLNAPTGTINLPKETQGKTMFGELEVGTEFLWKTERLFAVGSGKAGGKKKNCKEKQKNVRSYTPSASSSPPIRSITPSGPSSPPIRPITPPAPSSPSILVGMSSAQSAPSTQNSTNSAITPCIGHRGYVNVPLESFKPSDIFKPVTVVSKRKRKAKQVVDL